MKDTPNAPPKNGNSSNDTTIRIKRDQHIELVQEYRTHGFENLLSYTTYIFDNREKIMQTESHLPAVSAPVLPPSPPVTMQNYTQEQPAPHNAYKDAYEREAEKTRRLQAAIEQMLEFTVDTHDKKGLFNFTSWSREAIETQFAHILIQNGLQ